MPKLSGVTGRLQKKAAMRVETVTGGKTTQADTAVQEGQERQEAQTAETGKQKGCEPASRKAKKQKQPKKAKQSEQVLDTSQLLKKKDERNG